MGTFQILSSFVACLISTFRPIIQRYQTCTDPASVIAMQEVIIGEMETEQADRRTFEWVFPIHQPTKD